MPSWGTAVGSRSCDCVFLSVDPGSDGLACTCGHMVDEHGEGGKCLARMPEDVFVVPEVDDEEELIDPESPAVVTRGNRKWRRRHGERSNYAERLRALQRRMK